MSDKELLYMEDAFEHERIIDTFLNSNLPYLEDDDLSEFFEKEISKHASFKEKIFECMKEKSNE